MFHRYLFLILIIFLPCQSILSAGAACFNYEVFQHQQPPAPPPPPPVNLSLTNYDYATIRLRHIAIPANQVSITLMIPGGAGLWNHTLLPPAPPLTLAQACQIAIDRQNIGIRINF